nr:putative beta-lysine N-acetyltransferase [Tumebacillus amylolyticus]
MPLVQEPTVTVDALNQRILIRNFRTDMWPALKRRMHKEMQAQPFQKVVLLSREQEVRFLMQQGFVLEATVDQYWQDGPVYYMSRFLTSERREAAHWVKEDSLLEDVLRTEGHSLPPLSVPFQVRQATARDIPQLAALYRKVFASYPSPLTEPAYLKKSLVVNPFSVIEVNGEIVSAAAAEIDAEYRNAEMTNCATDDAYRGRGLMRHLLRHLEDRLIERNIVNAFSIARARSFGMNAALHQEGYRYGGRLVNNCHICGNFEDMNVWGKVLKKTKGAWS